MTMGILAEITTLVETVGVPVYVGYPPTDAKLPYVVHRPLIVSDEDLAVDGSAIDWDYQTSLYCCANGVEASFNLALAVMSATQGQRVGGTTVSTSMGYAGSPVEGHYESQVTIQIMQGGI